MRVWQAVKTVATVLSFLLAFIGSLVGVFFLTAWLYHSIGHAPPPLLAQVINTLLGLTCYAAMIIGFATLSSIRQNAARRPMGIFEPIFGAMEQIAKGDFRVRVPYPVRANAFASELAKSINQMALELDQMEHMRQEFISNVSHEIQSPLTSIRGFAQALHDERLSAEEHSHYLGIIETESLRLSRMTDNMLKLAVLEAEDMRLDRKPYRLDKQLRALILACEPQWMGKAIDIEAALEEIEIVADEDLLGQVWSNLLHNSIKFTPEGGRVRVAAQQRGCAVECTISDTGIGIPEEAQAHIFERFYKADAARERSREGSGLGLAIAQKIVGLHQGSIGVTSQPGMGTTITVSLPMQ